MLGQVSETTEACRMTYKIRRSAQTLEEMIHIVTVQVRDSVQFVSQRDGHYCLDFVL